MLPRVHFVVLRFKRKSMEALKKTFDLLDNVQMTRQDGNDKRETISVPSDKFLIPIEVGIG